MYTTQVITTRLFLFFCFAITQLLQGCDSSTDPIVPVNYVQNLEVKYNYTPANWRVAGPFYCDSSFSVEKFSDLNPLRQWGVKSEEEINELSFYQNDQSDYTDDLFYLDSYSERNIKVENGFFTFDSLVANRDATSVMYLSCIINSDKEQKLAIRLGNTDGVKVFLNNETLFTSFKERSFYIYRDVAYGRLKKGENLLVVKLCNSKEEEPDTNEKRRWEARIELKTQKSYYIQSLKSERNYIVSNVVPQGYSLEISDVFSPTYPVKELIIENEYGTHIVKKGTSIEKTSLASLKTGLYHLTLVTALETFSQDFYYGDVLKDLDSLVIDVRRVVRKSDNYKEVSKVFEPVVKRYDLLMDFYEKKSLFLSSSGGGSGLGTNDNLKTLASRWQSVNKPKSLKFTSAQLDVHPISEINFYKNGSDSLIQLMPDGQSENIESILQDKDLKSTWLPEMQGNSIEYTFSDSNRPDYVQVIMEPIADLDQIQRNIVFLFKELKTIKSNIDDIVALNFRPGSHLRNYISEVDASKQNYILQIPEKGIDKNKKIPLVITIPIVVANHMPFLRSHSIAAIGNVVYTQYFVNKTNVIRVLPEARTFNRPAFAPIAEKDVLTLIDELSSIYPIDRSKVFLNVYCGGTPLTLNLASKYPHIFNSAFIAAGVGTFWKTNADWLIRNQPIYYTSNLTNTGLFAVNERLDTHSPLFFMEKYVEQARATGVNVKFIINEGSVERTKDPYRIRDRTFSFFASRGSENPKKVTYTTFYHKYNQAYWLKVFPVTSGYQAKISASIVSDTISVNVSNAKRFSILPGLAPIDPSKKIVVIVNGEQQLTYNPPFKDEIVIGSIENEENLKNQHTEGPILDAFGDRFIVVKGSIGAGLQKAYGDTIVDHFIKTWEENYYVKPIVKKDYNISKTDIRDSHLILVGNQNTNSFFRKIYNDLPVKVSEKLIELRGQIYRGESLGYYVIYPNPLNKKKYVVLIGGNDLVNFPLKKGVLSEEGYFDFEIFDYSKSRMEPIKRGNFNDNWELTN